MDKVINSSNNEKMSEYCKTCICKSCEQVAWLEQENEELKDKSDYWKDKYADVHIRLTNQISELKAENEKLKTECEELKARKDKYYKMTLDNEIQISDLMQECDRLKKEIRLYNCIDKFGTEQCRCACRCLGNEFCQDADKRINKYRQTLQEIMVIAEDRTKTEDYLLGQEYTDLVNKILDKINEVIGDNNG